MTEPHDPNQEGNAVRELVKRAFQREALGKGSPDILRGVQRRIRIRSRGKFFADGWSVTQARNAYLLVALVTLFLVGFAYYALLPMDIH